MAYASIAGRARTNALSPQAHAICDRCGFRYNRVDLQYQFEWAGNAMQNLRRAVCRTCLDVPQDQNRSILVPADPMPINDPRPLIYTDTPPLLFEDGTPADAEDGDPLLAEH